MNWKDKKEVQKGDAGERLVDAYLVKKGVIPYSPAEIGAHPFDRLCATRDKKKLFIAEVKTKPRRASYPDTGINASHLKTYLDIQARHSLNVVLFFVDEVEKRIYGNAIDELMRDRVVEHCFQQLIYPRRERSSRGEIVYFPLCAMVTVANLQDMEAAALMQLSQAKESYRQAYREQNGAAY